MALISKQVYFPRIFICRADASDYVHMCMCIAVESMLYKMHVILAFGKRCKYAWIWCVFVNRAVDLVEAIQCLGEDGLDLVIFFLSLAFLRLALPYFIDTIMILKLLSYFQISL